MLNKNTIIGFLVGILSTFIGSAIYIMVFSDYNFIESLEQITTYGSLSKLINLGALLNIVVFYVFLYKKQDDRAKGVLLATLALAIVFLIHKL